MCEKSRLLRSDAFLNNVFSLGIVLMTMTSLRSEALFIGFGELFILLWLIKKWFGIIKKNKVSFEARFKHFIVFWVGFFGLLIVGSLISAMEGRLLVDLVVHDIMAYFFAFAICFTLSVNGNGHDIEDKIKRTAVIGTLVFAFFALWWGTINNGFFGIGLGEYRFTGGARNPNQLALFFVLLPSVLVYFINKTDISLLQKVTLAVLLIASVFVGIYIRSDALNAAWILSIMTLIILTIGRLLKPSVTILTLVLIVTVVGVFILLDNSRLEVLISDLKTTFDKLDEDGSRFYLWTEGLEVALDSPLFGFGPGAHIMFTYSARAEAHNTFIDLFTQTGLIGLSLYLWMIKKTYCFAKENSFMVVSLITLMAFSGAHFVLRQPVFWVYLYYLAGFQVNNTNTEGHQHDKS